MRVVDYVCSCRGRSFGCVMEVDVKSRESEEDVGSQEIKKERAFRSRVTDNNA